MRTDRSHSRDHNTERTRSRKPDTQALPLLQIQLRQLETESELLIPALLKVPASEAQIF